MRFDEVPAWCSIAEQGRPVLWVEGYGDRDDGSKVINTVGVSLTRGMLASMTRKIYNRAPTNVPMEGGPLFRVGSLQAERLTRIAVENVAVSHSVRPSLSREAVPCSNHSSRDIQNSFLPFMISASTAPPRNTMCFRRGGSSILILNFCKGPIFVNHPQGQERCQRSITYV